MLHPGTIHRRENLINIGCYNPLIYYRRLRESESRKTRQLGVATKDYLIQKSALLAAGKSAHEADSELFSVISTLQQLPRLAPLVKGRYEYEMATAFEEGTSFVRSTQFYLHSLWIGYGRKGSLKGIFRCLKKYFFTH